MWGRSTKKYPHTPTYEAAARLYERTKPLRGKPDFRPFDQRSSRASAQILKRGEDYVIRLYHTDILTYRSDGSVELCHGGWETQATAAALHSMGPVACYRQNGQLVIRSLCGDEFRIPDTGLIIKDGEPRNPKPAYRTKQLVNKAKAAEARRVFQHVPKFIKAYSAAFEGAASASVRYTGGAGVIEAGQAGVELCEQEASELAMRYLPTVFSYNNGGGCVVINDPTAATKAFWADVYRLRRVYDTVKVEMPLGEV